MTRRAFSDRILLNSPEKLWILIIKFNWIHFLHCWDQLHRTLLGKDWLSAGHQTSLGQPARSLWQLLEYLRHTLSLLHTRTHTLSITKERMSVSPETPDLGQANSFLCEVWSCFFSTFCKKKKKKRKESVEKTMAPTQSLGKICYNPLNI